MKKAGSSKTHVKPTDTISRNPQTSEERNLATGGEAFHTPGRTHAYVLILTSRVCMPVAGLGDCQCPHLPGTKHSTVWGSGPETLKIGLTCLGVESFEFRGLGSGDGVPRTSLHKRAQSNYWIRWGTLTPKPQTLTPKP